MRTIIFILYIIYLFETFVYGSTLIVTDVEIYLYDAVRRPTLDVVPGCFMGCEGCVKYPKDVQCRDMKKNVLYHTKSATTLIYIYSLYTIDHIALSCAILCSCQSLRYVPCFHSYYLISSCRGCDVE